MKATKITAIIGEPATGKSTLMKAFMALVQEQQPLGSWCDSQIWGFFMHQFFAGNGKLSVSVLGRYDDAMHQFPGTDRLSMAVQPRVVDWLDRFADGAVLWEGARLGTASLFWHLVAEADDFKILSLHLPPEELHARRIHERSQSERFLKAKATQIKNLHADFPEYVLPARHAHPNDAATLARWLYEERT